MTLFETIREDRQHLAIVMKKHKGIRRVVEDLYPDRAHFIFELLQNAEDAGATEAGFTLAKEGLTFRHNGRPFTPEDVWGITDIGEGTKAEDHEKIGKFGIGFKAVFLYTENPSIWSPRLSFRLADLVLPYALDSRPDNRDFTVFYFPFDNPKKPREQAWAEVKSALDGLDANTLLFLSHLQSISWQSLGGAEHRVERLRHSETHVELRKVKDGRLEAPTHMLMFSTALEGYGAAPAAIAFELEFAPGIDTFSPEKPLGLQMRIASADPGRVAVFFPTEKEHSGLRFHVHAPFIPELSRASVKDTPLNEPLFGAIAQLSAASLYTIRDLGMLSADFLGVLPNLQDSIPARYQCIREAIVSEMNDHPLTPVWQSGAKSVQEGGKSERAHAPARHLVQARAPLKYLLGSKDLDQIFCEEEIVPRWAIGSPRNSPQERFLSSLAIREWDAEDLRDFLYERLSLESRYREDLGDFVEEEDPVIRTWFDNKPASWHRDLYGLFQSALEDSQLDDFPDLRIVRMNDGSFLYGREAYFPTEEVEHDDLMPRVAREICLAQKGKSGKAEEQASKFLQGIGVREVGEVEQIESILKHRYQDGAVLPDPKDLPTFVQLVEKYPNQAKLFQQACIIRAEDGRWVPPGKVYLDTPFRETGLAAYHAQLGKKSTRVAIAPSFLDKRISEERFSEFAVRIGVQDRLEILCVSCIDNPEWKDNLRWAPGERNTSPIDRDYTIQGFPGILLTPTIAYSRLIWNRLNSLPAEPNSLKARFRRNATNGSRFADSQLVHQLRNHAWVPLSDGAWVRPAEACREMLCEDFHFDPSKPWIQAVHFGQEVQARTAEEARKKAVLKELRLDDPDKLARVQEFAQLPVEDQQEFLDACRRRRETQMPEAASSHPEQRSKRVAEQAADAPERQVESRSRSVSVNRDAVKKEAQEYLTQQYTNPEGDMICQVCRARLPFKLADGSFYFEKVEFLDDLTLHHYQNYLALCPNHAAMFKHANGSTKTLRELVSGPGVNEITIVLAGKARTLHFTRNHLADLRAVIKGEKTEPQGES